MADIIRLLSENVANQIAAGEVIQRPASAVKEMLENAMDAGASRVQLILLDAGKTLIQVIDDGSGMSETDARLCFDRHATSKIRKIDDLFTLHTMGFRGEALASIASVAQVEMKTRRAEFEFGQRVVVEGGTFMLQEAAVMPGGTSIAVKNLFFNVPARRNFLKSNPVESRHIQEEFIRIALANPHISFSMHHNEAQVFDLRTGNLRQRISAIFGNAYNERLVPVEEETTIVRIEGYIGKPEFAKRNRGEQYFYVNNRFIKDNYLHHAVSSAFDSLIPKEGYPSYWLKLSVNPADIDVNIHPTKTEIKFQHDKEIYAIIKAAVKRALGRFSVAPSLDFEQEPAFDLPLSKLSEMPVQPQIRINPNYNPFRQEQREEELKGNGSQPAGGDFGERHYQTSRSDVRAWLEVHKDTAVQQVITHADSRNHPVIDLLNVFEELDDFRFVLVSPGIVAAAHARGLVLFDLPAARERILYEKFLYAFSKHHLPSQQQLFPPQINLSPNDFLLVRELQEDLRKIGFDITEFGQHTIVVQGVPGGLDPGSEQATLQALLEQYRMNKDKLQLPVHENLARSLARSFLLRQQLNYSSRELRQVAIDLLHCDQPFYGVNGKVILKSLETEQLNQFMQSAG
ncbi:MAG: DNA mismatch repair endonuclease MutL [Bacteroidetes bacterium]|nr:DNA mismatch repair endonuclease MutL [Bacteroidota bacterium]